ncbi:MAG TPA: ABC transporter substrate-binding protein [Ktedonobacteraceae bacterium]|nr:ABC transporter substrate-binding protein [Ktedonobacteraceae bacterium]
MIWPFYVVVHFIVIDCLWKKKRYLAYGISILAILSIIGNTIPLTQSWFEASRQWACLSAIGWQQQICGNALRTETIFARDLHNPDHGNYVTIGITDGSDPFIFDGSHDNSAEKEVITKIAQENAVVAKASHIDLVVLTTLSRTLDDFKQSVSVGIEDLRGAYLSIKTYNNKDTNTIKVRLLIANVGTMDTVDTTVPLIMDQILVLSQQDSALRGMIGLPFSQATKVALTGDWKRYHSSIPLISPSATSNDFSNTPLFYRISSSDKQQVCDMVHEIKTNLGPAYTKIDPNSNPRFTIALFYDEGDAYSFSLEQSTRGIIAQDERYLLPGCAGATDINLIPEKITLNNADTYQAAIKDAVAARADMIFFAGYVSDLNAFETQLESVQKFGYRIPIVGADGLFDIAGNITVSYTDVYSTTYASPVEARNSVLSNLLELYQQNFGKLQVRGVKPLLPPHAILAYDAASAFLEALDNSRSSQSQLPGQDAFNSALATVNFRGASGLVQFQGNSRTDSSNPLNKPVYIMCEDKNFQLREVAKYDPDRQPVDDIANCGQQ